MKAQHIRPTTSTTAGILLALGIVYGDIGTSPLYVMKEIIHGNQGIISRPFIFGVISLIFWTVTLLTTVKYVFLALKADNHGEGGIFSLYTLLRKQKKMVNRSGYDWWCRYFSRRDTNSCSNRYFSR